MLSLELMKRLWEVDTGRGFAILAMIVFHIFFDLYSFEMLDFDIYSDFWWIFPRLIAGSFVFLVGVSLTLSYARVRQRKPSGACFKKYLLRGLFIFTLGLIITIITWFIFAERLVLFGVLHLIGVSIILAYPFIRFKYINLVLAVIILAAGVVLWFYRFDFFWLFFLGLRPQEYYPFDYLPLIPWFGVVLLGIFWGNLLYQNGQRRFPLIDLQAAPPIKLLCFLGRHSLIVYFLHRPLVYGAVYLVALLRTN